MPFLSGSLRIADLGSAILLDPVTPGVTVNVTYPDITGVEGSTELGPINVGTRIRVTYQWPAREWDIPEYKVLISDTSGEVYAELENAALGQIPLAITGTTSFHFSIPSDDPKATWIQEWRYEVQVWRNDRLIWGGPITKVINDGSVIDATCEDLRVYFGRRVIGRVPKENLLVTWGPGEPAMPLKGWQGRSLPRSPYRGGPARSASKSLSYSDRPAMRLSSSRGKTSKTYSNDDWFTGRRLSAAAKTELSRIMKRQDGFFRAPRITVAVYDDKQLPQAESVERARDRAEAVSDYILRNFPHARVQVSAPGSRRPVATNKTSAGREANRRVVVTYQTVSGGKGHKQHVRQFVTVRNPRPNQRKQAVTFSAYVYVENAAGWAAGMKGMELVRYDPRRKHPDKKWRDRGYKKPLQRSNAVIADASPMQAWYRMTCTVVLPNNGKKSLLECRLFPPNGDVLFSEIWLTRKEGLYFRDREQAQIIRRLVKHAQDEDMGKSSLNIETNIQKTGITRTREYPFDERATILDLLDEFPTLANGMEWRIVQTPKRRVFTTYYPRMGKESDLILASGTNVASYTINSDGSLMATTVIVQTGDENAEHAREERTASDSTILDDLTLEKVYTGTPNSPPSSWRAQAERGLARYRRPAVIPTVTIPPEYTEELLARVDVGDVITTDISDEALNVDDFQKVRITEMRIDPQTDTVTLTLYPEDLKVERLSKFGDRARYFSQPQNPIVGSDGKEPVESNVEFAATDYDDSAWETGKGGIGWVREATGNYVVLPTFKPKTTIPDNHEVWVRKTVRCTNDMVITLRASDWSYLYVNGHRISDPYFSGYNRHGKVAKVNLRIPQEFLNESGRQAVALHVQYDPKQRASAEMSSLYADFAVRGTNALKGA